MPIAKIVLLGDGMVGKTAIKERFLKNIFPDRYATTVGADFAVKTLTVDNVVVTLQIWDLAGQPRFNMVRNMYYKGTAAAIFVYDTTNRKSLDNLKNWALELMRAIGNKQMPAMLLGNKIDIRDMNNVNHVKPQEGQAIITMLKEILKSTNIKLPFIEVSALTGDHVEEAFVTLTRNLLNLNKH